MPKKKEEKNELLDDLNKLDDPKKEEDPKPDDELPPEPEEELSIVDQFVSGDMDAVKQTIQDQVIKTVSDVVNGSPEEDTAPPED